jgi:hypothetical protein
MANNNNQNAGGTINYPQDKPLGNPTPEGSLTPQNAPVKPAQPKVKAPAKEVTQTPVEKVVTPVADRSAYNCSTCKGEGLVSDQRCSVCNGTGKV